MAESGTASSGTLGALRARLSSRFLVPVTLRVTLLLILAVALVPILLIQGFIYRSHFETHRQQEMQANLELARASALVFEAFVQDVLHQEAALGRAITSARFVSSEEVNAILLSSSQEYGAVRACYELNVGSGRLMVWKRHTNPTRVT